MGERKHMLPIDLRLRTQEGLEKGRTTFFYRRIDKILNFQPTERILLCLPYSHANDIWIKSKKYMKIFLLLNQKNLMNWYALFYHIQYKNDEQIKEHWFNNQQRNPYHCLVHIVLIVHPDQFKPGSYSVINDDLSCKPQ